MPQAAVVLVGGHEGGGTAAVGPSMERGPLIRSASARRELDVAVRQVLKDTDLPVCVVPMTLGRDPQLVADSARTLMTVAGGVGAGRVVLADPFATATLLIGWLRVAVTQAVEPLGLADMAVVLTARAANRFDDAELFRIAHLVKVQTELPSVEVGFRGGDPDLADVLDRCKQLGARHFAVIPADFRPAVETPMSGVIDGGPLLSPSMISGMLGTRIAAALTRLSQGDDGIAAGLDADHDHGHGGDPWQEPDSDAG
jgi:hypothetical protein